MNKDEIVESIKMNTIVTFCIIIFMVFMPLIVVSGMTVGNDADKNQIKVENNSNNNTTITLDGKDNIKVFLTDENRVEELTVDEYLYGVISSEMSPTFEEEALKAQAIAARTFVLNRSKNNCTNANGAYICDTVHCQVYRNSEKVISSWDSGKKDEYWNKIKKAVDSTSGMVITYKGEIIKYPQFFSTSSGKTENCKDVFSSDVPYLVSIESTGEEISPSFKSTTELEITEFIDKVNSKYPDAKLSANTIQDQINIVGRSEAGGVLTIKLGNSNVKGTELRMLLGLKSTNFNYRFDGSKIIFECTGYGHGVGMSQWGANVMAKSGNKYDEILKHYYTGIDISKVTFNNK